MLKLKNSTKCVNSRISRYLSFVVPPLSPHVFGTEIVSKIPELLQSSESFDYSSQNINERELAIIRLIANGYSNKEIAAELFLSEGTVRNYLSSILDKLKLRDRTQVAVFYYQHK